MPFVLVFTAHPIFEVLADVSCGCSAVWLHGWKSGKRGGGALVWLQISRNCAVWRAPRGSLLSYVVETKD